MILRSKTQVVTESYKGKSKFDFWKNLKVGHTFELSTKIENTLNRRGTNYAITLKITNVTTGEYFVAPNNTFINYLSKMKFTEY